MAPEPQNAGRIGSVWSPSKLGPSHSPLFYLPQAGDSPSMKNT